jgi:subtilisin family serine protease
LLLAVTALATAVAMATPAAAHEPEEPEEPGRYVVLYHDDVDPDTRAEELLEADEGVEIDHVYEEVFTGFAGTIPDEEVEQLRADPDVIAVVEDVRGSSSQVGSVAGRQRDPTWGLDRIDQRQRPLSGRYRYANSGKGVTAYIIDSGIRGDHVEFGSRVRRGFSVFPGQGARTDCLGHGTHVAGTVGGRTYGVAKRVTLRPIRVLSCDDVVWASDFAAGVDWMIQHHRAGAPAVANVSLWFRRNQVVDDAVRAAIDDGITVVVSGGNFSAPACDISPTRIRRAVRVGATDRHDRRAGFSNFGSCLDLFAPGVDVRSAVHWSPTATDDYSGTSMAAPHVAGVAAVRLAQEPAARPWKVKKRLLTDASPGEVLDPGTGSPNRLLFSPAATPPNDRFGKAQTFSLAGTSPQRANNDAATKQGREPNHAGNAGGRSLWWTFTPASSGQVTLSTRGSSFDTTLAVYRGGSLGQLREVASNDDFSEQNFRSRVQFRVRAGRTYRVAVDGHQVATSGRIFSGAVRLHHTWRPD